MINKAVAKPNRVYLAAGARADHVVPDDELRGQTPFYELGGALLVSKDGCEHLRTPTVPIKSKVGAGDSMVGGIVLALERGKVLREAVLCGVAAGAAAVMNPQRELCRRQDAEELFSRMISEQKGGVK